MIEDDYTVTKTMLPLLRTGFVVAPASHGDRPTKAASAASLDGGFLAGHVRRASSA